jgi:hypothetical protein
VFRVKAVGAGFISARVAPQARYLVGAGFISARVAPQARYLVGAGFISARVACLCSSQKQMAFSLFERYCDLSASMLARRGFIAEIEADT